MSVEFTCGECRSVFEAGDHLAGKLVRCGRCGATVRVPGSKVSSYPVSAPAGRRASPPNPPPAPQPTPPAAKSEAEKHCVECAAVIHRRAVVCPKCGVPQPVHTHGAAAARSSIRGTIKTTLIVSAVGNLVVAVIWAATCFGVVFSVPLAALGICELVSQSSADTCTSRQLKSKAFCFGLFELVFGLFNTVALICGIINLINASKVVGDEVDFQD